MNVMDTMKERLAGLQPDHLELVDESARHVGHAHAEAGHFKLYLVSAHFDGLGTMARHRLVYDALGDLMGPAIHALTITARTPKEHSH